MTGQPPILVVEDNDDDLLLLKRLLAKARIENPALIAHSGTEAIAMLERIDRTGEGAVPCMVLTDLKTPGLCGLDLATWLRRHDRFSRAKIVMLSTSSLATDVARAMSAGVDKFFVKFPTATALREALLGQGATAPLPPAIH